MKRSNGILLLGLLALAALGGWLAFGGEEDAPPSAASEAEEDWDAPYGREVDDPELAEEDDPEEPAAEDDPSLSHEEALAAAEAAEGMEREPELNDQADLEPTAPGAVVDVQSDMERSLSAQEQAEQTRALVHRLTDRGDRAAQRLERARSLGDPTAMRRQQMILDRLRAREAALRSRAGELEEQAEGEPEPAADPGAP